jgi:threonine/homoserine/homoserine lactone efflux protein
MIQKKAAPDAHRPHVFQKEDFMEMSAMLVFATAVIAMQAAPGPVVAVALSRAMNRDMGGCIAFGSGVCIGQLIPIAIIALGFGVWVQDNAQFLTGFRLLGAAYMLWLAWQMWNASVLGARAGTSTRGWMASAGAGAAICLGSPYTIVFYLLMLPSVAPAGLTDFPTVSAIILISVAMTAGTLAAMMLMAAQVHHVLATPRLSKIFNRVVATLLAGASVLLLLA